jgi:hypothetical protein
MSSLTVPHREFQNPAILERLLQPLPRSLRRQAAADFDWDKWSRKITFEPFFRMQLLLALTRYQTLSELQVAMGHDPLFRLHGANLEVSVSALAQVPTRRGSGPFQALLTHVFAQVAALPQTAKRARGLTTATLTSIQELLVQTQIIDSSTFPLPPTIAKWAQVHTHGAGAAGYKLHLRLAGGYGGLAQIDFSPAREHDRPHLDPLAANAEPGQIFLVDRGYQDYRLFERWTAAGVFFVSKLKESHQAVVLEATDLQRVQTPSGYVLLKELRVRLGPAGKTTASEYRLLDVLTPDGQFTTLITNLWELAPAQICALMQYRWSIEIVFRWLKHTLGLQHLISTQKEGVEIQIVMALLVYALLVLYQEGEAWSPKYLLLRMQALLNEALIAYGYERAEAERHPPPPPEPCFLA